MSPIGRSILAFRRWWRTTVSIRPTHLPSTRIIHQDRVHVVHRAHRAPRHSDSTLIGTALTPRPQPSIQSALNRRLQAARRIGCCTGTRKGMNVKVLHRRGSRRQQHAGLRCHRSGIACNAPSPGNPIRS